jgi:hypothetical protein
MRWVLVYDLALRDFARTQPQRDMGRLHSLPYHPYQFAVQRLQVCLIPQSGRETFERLPRVVLFPVEAPVDKALDTPPQGLNRAAITRVETTIASCGSSSLRVSVWRTDWVIVTPRGTRAPVSR